MNAFTVRGHHKLDQNLLWRLQYSNKKAQKRKKKLKGDKTIELSGARRVRKIGILFFSIKTFIRFLLKISRIKNLNKSKTHNYANRLKITHFFSNTRTLITKEIFTKSYCSSSSRFKEEVGVRNLF